MSEFYTILDRYGGQAEPLLAEGHLRTACETRWWLLRRQSVVGEQEWINYVHDAGGRWLNSGFRGFGDIRLELTSVRPVSHLLVLSFRTGPQIHAYSASWKENGEYCYHWWGRSGKCCNSIEQNNICIDAMRPRNNRRMRLNKLTARMSSTWPAS